ncbi:hypothetical protein AB9G26_03360 [Francisella philomiragia]|uniref:hypothetical protein n=1 Tax=Francisella philomiragia TaxID=28110 RepID=UPI0035193CFA
MLILIILFFLLFPIAQAYLIKSKISNCIRETDEVRKEVAFSIRFDDKFNNLNLPKDVYVEQQNNITKVKIDVGQTGKKIVNGSGYIFLTPTFSKTNGKLVWRCNALGTGLQENYLPGNCKLLKK